MFFFRSYLRESRDTRQALLFDIFAFKGWNFLTSEILTICYRLGTSTIAPSHRGAAGRLFFRNPLHHFSPFVSSPAQRNTEVQLWSPKFLLRICSCAFEYQQSTTVIVCRQNNAIICQFVQKTSQKSKNCTIHCQPVYGMAFECVGALVSFSTTVYSKFSFHFTTRIRQFGWLPAPLHRFSWVPRWPSKQLVHRPISSSLLLIKFRDCSVQSSISLALFITHPKYGLYKRMCVCMCNCCCCQLMMLVFLWLDFLFSFLFTSIRKTHNQSHWYHNITHSLFHYSITHCCFEFSFPQKRTKLRNFTRKIKDTKNREFNVMVGVQ